MLTHLKIAKYWNFLSEYTHIQIVYTIENIYTYITPFLWKRNRSPELFIKKLPKHVFAKIQLRAIDDWPGLPLIDPLFLLRQYWLSIYRPLSWSELHSKKPLQFAIYIGRLSF